MRKVKPGFTGARVSEWQWHHMGHMQICTLIQTQPHQHPTTQFFYSPDALSAPPLNQQHQSTENNISMDINVHI